MNIAFLTALAHMSCITEASIAANASNVILLTFDCYARIYTRTFEVRIMEIKERRAHKTSTNDNASCHQKPTKIKIFTNAVVIDSTCIYV